MDDVQAAKALIKCLDLTSLNDNDNDQKIIELCAKAITPHGKVAAVCVYPRFIILAKKQLAETGIKVATVVNFPEGSADIAKLTLEINNALKFGADEIDAVFPYQEFLKGNISFCEKYVAAAANLCASKVPLKMIIESGELKKASLIAQVSKLCINHGVNFIKTSTSKTPTSATPEAANIILETIAASKSAVGFKASGGIKTIDDAKKYLVLANSIMGFKWSIPKNFRIGASSLLDNLLAIIKRGY